MKYQISLLERDYDVGHHTYEVMQGLADWMTSCIEAKMTPEHFDRIWDEWGEWDEWEEWDDDEANHPEVPGFTTVGAQDEVVFWKDANDADDLYNLNGLYRKAVAANAIGFVITDRDSYVNMHYLTRTN